jgi:hypothetical protein
LLASLQLALLLCTISQNSPLSISVQGIMLSTISAMGRVCASTYKVYLFEAYLGSPVLWDPHLSCGVLASIRYKVSQVLEEAATTMSHHIASEQGQVFAVSLLFNCKNISKPASKAFLYERNSRSSLTRKDVRILHVVMLN